MILDKYIEVTIINHNIEHYKKLGYIVKCKDKIIVKSEELSNGSHCRVNCLCDNCREITNIKYQDYIRVINKNGKYICNNCNKKKFNDLLKNIRKKSLNKKYGVDNVFQLEFVKNKIKETNIRKYGVPHRKQNEKVKEKDKENRIKNGTQIPDNKLSEYQIYKKKVLYYTRKDKKLLYEQWNGLDYYDNELIINNKNLHYNNESYPNIDHKISIKSGFINNINPKIIGSINNLCVTKRINNLSKGSKYSMPKKLKEIL